MQTPKIIITGASGQLGLSVRNAAAEFGGYDFLFLSRADLPVDDDEGLASYFGSIQPDFCINCAAYTAVDAAESNVEEAFAVNAGAVKTLAEVCRDNNTKLIHISTDYVFNGQSSTPYQEDTKVDPINVYGASKAKGEELAIAANPETIIIRTSWVYSEYGKNFVKTMIRLMGERDQLNVVSDQTGAPTYAPDLAKAILRIIDAGAEKPGIFHYCNEGSITWYEFALAIRELTGSNCQVNPIPSSAYPLPAKRPSFSLLDTSAITREYGIEMLPWKQSLKNCLQKLLP